MIAVRRKLAVSVHTYFFILLLFTDVHQHTGANDNVLPPPLRSARGAGSSCRGIVKLEEIDVVTRAQDVRYGLVGLNTSTMRRYDLQLTSTCLRNCICVLSQAACGKMCLRGTPPPLPRRVVLGAHVCVLTFFRAITIFTCQTRHLGPYSEMRRRGQ